MALCACEAELRVVTTACAGPIVSAAIVIATEVSSDDGCVCWFLLSSLLCLGRVCRFPLPSALLWGVFGAPLSHCPPPPLYAPPSILPSAHTASGGRRCGPRAAVTLGLPPAQLSFSLPLRACVWAPHHTLPIHTCAVAPGGSGETMGATA